MGIFDFLRKNKYADSFFVDLNFWYNDDYFDHGQITHKFLKNKIFEFVEKTIELKDEVKHLSDFNSNGFFINISGKKFDIKTFPCLISLNEFKSMLEEKMDNEFVQELFSLSFFKFIYHISIVVNKGNERNFDATYNWTKDKEIVNGAIKICEKFLNSYFDYLDENISDEYDSYEDHDDIEEIIDKSNSENFYDDFKDSYEKFLEKYFNSEDEIDDESEFQFDDSELNQAYNYFGLPKNCSLAEFKKIYKEFARKYHPDFGANPSDTEMMTINKYRVLIEKDKGN